jgi:hypothetical protein
VIERSTRFSSDSRVCSSIIDAIFDRLAVDGGSELEVDRPHHLWGISPIGGIEDTPARLHGLGTRTCRPSSRHSRWTFFLLTSRRSS